MKQYHIQFDGYWLEGNKRYVPEFSGIYLIYTCRYIPENNMLSLTKLIYIGKAENLKGRIATHKETEFSSVIKDGETLCYACAYVETTELGLIENALVFAEKPVCNTKLKDIYSFDDAQFQIEGVCDLLRYTNYTITTRKNG